MSEGLYVVPLSFLPTTLPRDGPASHRQKYQWLRSIRLAALITERFSQISPSPALFYMGSEIMNLTSIWPLRQSGVEMKQRICRGLTFRDVTVLTAGL